ncbi:hypothetical protein H634G_11145 [Metarhizium anisopliae BRIP 53293]|uniref:GH18 domain-containing protein n=1 Tax=Metarhizium anisopliae BRIP 53293 TaxID=1291518 RepID=A0A0D9NHW2_METAN|nr:hypothetical protein H634G_11145 [Metarhizium anisopliae BRIP 53293]
MYKMRTMLSVRSRPFRGLTLAVVALSTLALLYQILKSRILFPSWESPNPHKLQASAQPSLDLPPEYIPKPSDSQWCQERFGVKFLENVRDSLVSYCTPNSHSFSCFWSITTEERRDAMCYGRGAIYDAIASKFRLGCRLRDLSPEEIEKGTPQIPDSLTQYWYDTGPKQVIEKGVLLDANSGIETPRITSILVKREGSGNLWHVLMELLSLSWTLDTLQISMDIKLQKPYLSPAAASLTQVIFLDEHEDGPFVDMWRLFAKMPIRRIHELNNSEPATDLLIPFSGGSNTLWQGDWVELDCRESALVKAFVSRVLHFYKIPTPLRKNKEIIAKFIRRTNTRKLINETELIESVKRAVPHLNLEIIDFAGFSFADQLKIVCETDLLIGVHGAGLTHTMFLPPGSAVIEILPGNFAHMGFRNLAQILDHKYYRTHAKMHGDATGDPQWQFDAVEMEEHQLIHLVESAVRSFLVLLFGSTVAALDQCSPRIGAQTVVYWGQNGGGTLENNNLATYCTKESGIDIVVLSFLYQYGNGLRIPSGTIGQSCFISTTGEGQQCDDLAGAIDVCKSRGIKVLISLGGSDGAYSLSSREEAETIGQNLWLAYGKSKSNSSIPRPFGKTFVNGWDFDIESNSGNQFYEFLISKLRSNFASDRVNKYSITGAPQCPIPDPNMNQIIKQAQFDYLWVQFYNNPGCSVNGAINYNNWKENIANSPSVDAKIFIGVPASRLGATGTLSGEKYYLEPDQLSNLTREYANDIAFGGIMMWAAGFSDHNVNNGHTYAQQAKCILTSGKAC